MASQTKELAKKTEIKALHQNSSALCGPKYGYHNQAVNLKLSKIIILNVDVVLKLLI